MGDIARSAHVLKRETTLAIPRHFIFFDTETTQVKCGNGDIRQDFRLGWCVSYGRAYGRHKEQETWFSFTNVSAFWAFVFTHCQEKQRLWVIARNIVFDFTVCRGWEHLNREGYKLKFFCNNGTSVIVQVSKGKRTIVLLDSMNWFSESLAKTGERIGIPKMDIDFSTCTEAELSEYCRNDVMIEYANFKLFIRFLEGNSISRLCYTKASTAMAAYLFRHYHTPIYIHNNGRACRLEREAYKGGRCECFWLGELNHEKYYILDVNSLYPFVMRGQTYPVKYEALRHNTTIADLSKLIIDKAIVAQVQVETTEPVYAVKAQRTIFPIGSFETTLCTPEIRYALEYAHIRRVLDCVVYDKAEIFTSYVNTMYSLRRTFASAGNKEYEVLCKYLLNSLYGKFGQKAEQWVKVGNAPSEPDREELLLIHGDNKIRRIRYLLGEVFELHGYTEAFNSFPGIAAHVTAYARMYLWHLMTTCGHGNYLYCDTDSLIVNEQGYENLLPYIDDNELGKLKCEGVTYRLIIRGLKDYITDTKTVVKGVRKNAVCVSDNEYRQEQWPSFRGLLKSSDSNVYTVTHVTKHLSREYTKGRVYSTGQVTPFSLVHLPDRL